MTPSWTFHVANCFLMKCSICWVRERLSCSLIDCNNSLWSSDSFRVTVSLLFGDFDFCMGWFIKCRSLKAQRLHRRVWESLKKHDAPSQLSTRQSIHFIPNYFTDLASFVGIELSTCQLLFLRELLDSGAVFQHLARLTSLAWRMLWWEIWSCLSH